MNMRFKVLSAVALVATLVAGLLILGGAIYAAWRPSAPIHAIEWPAVIAAVLVPVALLYAAWWLIVMPLVFVGGALADRDRPGRRGETEGT